MSIGTVLRNYLRASLDATRLLWGYRRTLWWLLWRKGPRAWWSFLFVKLFVKEGHGALGWAFAAGMPVLKLFRRRFIRRPPYPYNLEIEVTTICDKRCVICEHTYWGSQEERRNLRFEELQTMLGPFPGLKWVDLTGEGDAFLNPDFPKMLRWLKQRRVCVYLADSFDRIEPAVAEELVRMGLDGIYLSMDAATADTYNRIKVGCDFDRVRQNVEHLLQLKRKYRSPVPELCFRYVITTENVHEMPHFVSMVADWQRRYDLGDGSRIEFAGLLAFPEIQHLFVPEVPEAILDEVMRRARELGVRIGLAHHSVGSCPPPERCTAWVEPYIMMGGYAMPCCAVMQCNDRQYLRQHCMGNLFELSFREMWNAEYYTRFRQTLADPQGPIPTICKDCRVYDTQPRAEKYGYVRFRPEGITPMTREELER